MEQATNLFTKGLQMDTHPMVQGNDTLTDCLNGTLITMNGDEVILQNDMGNRRVDLAFLPDGYEPIGIKEYGGIIYIAAYNPITNQSQIGSFPSPLRRYVSGDNESPKFEEDLTKNKSPFNKDIFTAKKSTGDDWTEVYAITNDIYLIKLINKPLCPGDKFLTTIDDDYNTILSNWNIVSPEYPYKNKLYTLSYGVLNSLNLFVDITKNLIRWNLTNNINDDNDDINNNDDNNGDDIDNNDYINVIIANSGNTELKFNSGYFLPVGNNGIEINIDNLQTLSDKELEKSRLKLLMNTYSGKLVGYPYIKVKLNHPVSFSYSHKGRIINDETSETGKSGELTIIGTIKYNCPIYSDSETINKVDYNKHQNIFMLFKSPNIPQFEEVHIDSYEIDTNDQHTADYSDQHDDENPFAHQFNGETPILGPQHAPTNTTERTERMSYSYIYAPKLKNIKSNGFNIISNESYDEFLNLYTVTVKKVYTIDSDKQFNGFLGVPVSDLYNNYIVGNLIQPISIDPNLFGTNKLYLSSFGWKKEDGKLLMRYNIDNYLYDEVEITEIQIGLKDLTGSYPGFIPSNNSTFSYKSLSINTGGSDIDLDSLYNSSLINRHYYLVTFEYKTSEDPNNWKTVDNIDEDLWLLNTPLLNKCYDYSNNEYYIKNYCNRTYKEELIFKELTVILYEDKSEYSLIVNPEEESSNNIKKFWNIHNDVFDLEFEHNITSTISIVKNIKIKNEKNYPADIGNVSAIISTEDEKFVGNISEDTGYIVRNGTATSTSTGTNDIIRNSITTNIEITNNNGQLLINLQTIFYDFFKSYDNGNPVLINGTRCLFPIDVVLDEIINNYVDDSYGPMINVDKGNRKVIATLKNIPGDFNSSIAEGSLTNRVKLNYYDTSNISLNGLIGYRSYDYPIFITNSPLDELFPYTFETETYYSGNKTNVCAYNDTIDNNNNSLVNRAHTSYIYLRGSNETLVLSDYEYYKNDGKDERQRYLTHYNLKDTEIRNVLLWYFGGRDIRVYNHNKKSVYVYTAHNARNNAIYTKIDNYRHYIVINLSFDIIHTYDNYKESSSNTRKKCYFTSDKLNSYSRDFFIDLKSYDWFLKNIEIGTLLEVTDMDIETQKIISINNNEKNGHLYASHGNSFSELTIGNGIKYITFDGKTFPTLTYYNNKDLLCYVRGKYKPENDLNEYNYTRTFYASFNQAGIYIAKQVSLP